MTTQDNEIPLYKRREDILPYIAEHHPCKGFTGIELLCLFAWPWDNEDELNEVISDMKWFRTDKTYPSKPVRDEQLDKVDNLAKMLVDNISLPDYLYLNEGYLRGLLPLKYSDDLYGEFSPGLYSDASHPIFFLGSSGGKLMEVIRSLFLNIYGQAALQSDKSIFDLDPFSEEALWSVLQSISEFEELFEAAECEDNPTKKETLRKELTSNMDFLLICRSGCEQKVGLEATTACIPAAPTTPPNMLHEDTSNATSVGGFKVHQSWEEIIDRWWKLGQKKVSERQMRNYVKQGLRVIHDGKIPTCTDQDLLKFIQERAYRKTPR